MLGKTNVGGVGGAGISERNAIVTVTCETEATVTMTKGGVTLTPHMWTLARDETHVCALFAIPPSLFDAQNAWTITRTKTGLQTQSVSMLVSENKCYETDISSVLYLIQDGEFNTSYTPTKAGYTSATLEESGGYVVFSGPMQSQTYALCYYDGLDLSRFTYLVFKGMAKGYYNAQYCPAFGVVSGINTSGSSSAMFAASRLLRTEGSNSYPASDETLVIDISSVTGFGTVGFQMAGSTYQDVSMAGGIKCKDFYLTNELPT